MRASLPQLRWHQVAPWLVWIVGVASVITGLATARTSSVTDVLGAVTVALPALTFVTVGTILVTRLPANLIGWLLVAGGFCLGVGLGAGGIAAEGLIDKPGSIPAAIWFAWLSEWLWAPAVGSIAGLALVYPTGHLLTRRWRPVAGLAIASIAFLALGSAIGPWAPGQFSESNPLLVAALSGPIADIVSAVIGLSALAVALLAVLSLVLRYRRAEGIERLQLKWFVFVAAISLPIFLVSVVLYGSSGLAGDLSNLTSFLAFLGFAALPIAIGLAVLRYRLYDIDQIINRTLVYGTLTAILAGSYAALVGLIQRLFVGLTGSTSDAAIVLTTLLVVSLFTPVKNRLQSLVDRRFKDAADRTRSLLELAASVESRLAPLDATLALTRLLRLTDDALQPTSGSVRLGSGEAARTVARLAGGLSSGSAAADPATDGSGLDVTVGVGEGAVRLILGPPLRRAYGEPDRAALLEAAGAIAGSLRDDLDSGTRLIGSRPTAEDGKASTGQAVGDVAGGGRARSGALDHEA